MIASLRPRSELKYRASAASAATVADLVPGTAACEPFNCEAELIKLDSRLAAEVAEGDTSGLENVNDGLDEGGCGEEVVAGAGALNVNEAVGTLDVCWPGSNIGKIGSNHEPYAS